MVEITEHTSIDDYGLVSRALLALRARGLRLAVDDAGAGYASLRHLLEMRPDLIKLDASLTRGIDLEPGRRALAQALIAFARATGAALVAEGIETAAEEVELEKLGVVLGQGYHLGRPGPLGAATPRRRVGSLRALGPPFRLVCAADAQGFDRVVARDRHRRRRHRRGGGACAALAADPGIARGGPDRLRLLVRRS